MEKIDVTSEQNISQAFKDDFLSAFLSCDEKEISVTGAASTDADVKDGKISKIIFEWSDLYNKDIDCENDILSQITSMLDDYMQIIQKNEEKEADQDFIRRYFELLVHLQTELIENVEAPEFNKRKALLEELSMLGCCRIKENNQYMVSKWHPVMLMQTLAEKEIMKEISAYQGMEKTILQDVIEIKTKLKRQYMICNYNEVFECLETEENDFPQGTIAKLFSEKGRLTRIEAIRLIEKIGHYKEKNKNINQVIKIACFEQLCEIDELFRYYDAEDIRLEVTTFQRKKENGEYFFVAAGCHSAAGLQSEAVEEMYNLLNQSDLEKLFADYSIVLLLDYSFFYKQRQEPKSVEERNENVYADWYLKRADQYEKFKDKAACYQTVFEYITIWINSFDRSRSSSYEFDENLYTAILNADRKAADVYLYISSGSKIGGKSLHRQNICNDEYYDGDELIVYRYPEEESDINEDLKTFLGGATESQRDIVYIDMWKLVKSVSNRYYKDFSDEVFEEKEDVHKNISLLKDIYCGIDYTDWRDKGLQFRIVTGNETDTMQIKKMEEFTKIILQHAFGKKKILCVRKYFKDLIVNSIISRADSVNSLLFAYLLEQGVFTDCELKKKNSQRRDGFMQKNLINGFKVRRTLFSIIEHVDDVRLRSGEKVADYFLINFRAKYCEDVNEEVFTEIMKALGESCKKFDYTESRLYLYSAMEN